MITESSRWGQIGGNIAAGGRRRGQKRPGDTAGNGGHHTAPRCRIDGMTDDETMIGTAGGPPGVPTTTKELLEIIDTLWGELPLDAVRRVTRERPDIADACKAVHELVWHA